MSRRRTIGTFVLVALLFGTAFPAIKAGLASLPPLAFAAARYTVSAVALLSFIAFTHSYRRPRTRADGAAVLAGGVLFIGGTGLTFVGQQYTTSGVAAIIVSLAPVLTVLLGWTLLPAERPSRRGLLGVAVGLAGVALVVRPTPGALLDPAVVGKSLIVTSTVIVTLGTVLVRRIHAPMPTIPLTAWSMAAGALVLAGASATLGEPVVGVTLSPTALGAVLYLGLGAGALGFGLYFQLLESVGALEANLVTYLSPVVALVAGWVLLAEPFPPIAIAGFGLIASGFGLLKNRELVAELARYRGAVP